MNGLRKHKYRSFGRERAVMLRPRRVVRVAAALILLEFGRYGRGRTLRTTAAAPGNPGAAAVDVRRISPGAA